MVDCDWNNPGANRLIEWPAYIVMRKHTEIPLMERTLLALKVASHQYNDQVEIKKNYIIGGFDYSPKITKMTFATGRMCQTITRNKWKDTESQGALVYIVGKYALGVAAICSNTFRLQFAPAIPAIPKISNEKVNYVSEPSTIFLVLFALSIILLRKRNEK